MSGLLRRIGSMALATALAIALVTFATCATFATFATSARADTPPNPWDAARDPAAADRYALHHTVRQLLASARLSPRDAVLLRARALLEEGHAADSPDVRLQFDLGELEYELENFEGTVEVLSKALKIAPDDPASNQAYVELANAYAKLDRSADERRVYERYLPRITSDAARAIALLNLAEADMHLGDLDGAIDGYRVALEVANQLPNEVLISESTNTLAVWGLAVALDRSGDVAGGAKEAKLAIDLDRDMLLIRSNRDQVFFKPERERDWYVALGFTEYAKQATEARTAATFWRRAEGCWREYIDDVRAHTAADRWADLARIRLERAHAQRLAAEKRIGAKGVIVYPQYECAR
ncbi:MAG TPA: hypothetical protein VGI39_16580 [Polyangiaceae bacterium]|jgi:tetratricopeptide (TPR) repeat protein